MALDQPARHRSTVRRLNGDLAALVMCVLTVFMLCAVMFSCDDRERTYKHQTPSERLRDGLRDPSRHPPGKGFNTD